MVCRNCNCELSEETKFCPKCGTPAEIGVENAATSLSAVARQPIQNTGNPVYSATESKEVSLTQKTKEFFGVAVVRFKSLSKKAQYGIVAGAIALIALFIIIGVATSTPKIVGKWENGDIGYIIFTDEGRFFVDNDNINGTYTVDGSQLKMYEGRSKVPELYYYDISNNILTLTGDDGDVIALFKCE